MRIEYAQLCQWLSSCFRFTLWEQQTLTSSRMTHYFHTAQDLHTAFVVSAQAVMAYQTLPKFHIPSCCNLAFPAMRLSIVHVMYNVLMPVLAEMPSCLLQVHLSPWEALEQRAGFVQISSMIPFRTRGFRDHKQRDVEVRHSFRLYSNIIACLACLA